MLEDDKPKIYTDMRYRITPWIAHFATVQHRQASNADSDQDNVIIGLMRHVIKMTIRHGDWPAVRYASKRKVSPGKHNQSVHVEISDLYDRQACRRCSPVRQGTLSAAEEANQLETPSHPVHMVRARIMSYINEL